jgi:ribose/xylose/arabinose/galactoside ABC-type transport system permease subunit
MSNTLEFKQITVWKRIRSSDNSYLFLGMISYIIVSTIIAPAFASSYNIAVVLEQMSVAGILTVGTCMVLISGGIDLSIGMELSASCALMSSIIYAGGSVKGNVFEAIIAGILLCVVGSFVMGFIISRTNVEPFIVSLGFMTIYQGIATIITNGAEYPIPGHMAFATNIRFLTIPLMVYIAIATFVVFGLLIRFMRFGRWLYAVGDNPDAAFLAGISVKNFKLLTYVINGVLVALASILMLSRTQVGNPTLGTGLELTAIAAAVVGGTALAGGKGSIIGAALGTAIVGMIANSLNIIGVNSFYQYVVTGVIIIAAVLINSLRSKRQN